MKTGIELIAAERERQIITEGWTPEHDDEHRTSELIDAAKSYAEEAAQQIQGGCLAGDFPKEWPWEPEWWKPSPDPIRNLVKAGSLIAAEIDRLSRKEERRKPPTSRRWTLIFETADGMAHPLRVTFETHMATEKDARRYGEAYMDRHKDWLKAIADCYLTDSQDN